MKVKELTPEDIGKIRELHEKFYSDLEFPDFFNGFMCAFLIDDDDDKLILAGGVRLIAESIVITNKDMFPSTRVQALLKALDVSIHVCKNTSPNITQLHAFVGEAFWSNQLQRHGFRKMISEALVLDI